ncbi:MAG: transposase, partial [Dehalococcoidales bacterium]|nr:transposase [Dehalococcoidales bacterium]
MAPATIEWVTVKALNLKQEEPSQMENTAARKRKQVPEGYLIIGVDPHKKRHAAVEITQGFTIRDKFKFDNTREGLETMLRRTRTEMVKADCRGVMFAIETGGHYWRNIAYFLD